MVVYMHQLTSNFKCIAAILLIFSGINACKDIPRDNVLDPKNPSSYSDWIISIEAFVNTENDKLYNEYLIEALNSISIQYPGKVTIAQYHRNVATFTDSLSIPENEYIYEDYINQFDSQKGVPDVFINGALERVKGSSSVENTIERIERALLPLLKENSHFTIEPELSRQEGNLSINIKLARLGSFQTENIFLRVMLIEKIDSEYLSRVVRSIQSSNLIPALEPGEVKEISFDGIEYNAGAHQSLILNVLSNEDHIVRQSIEVAIP